MRKILMPLCAILLLCSHDMYLKMDSYFLQPDQDATLSLYNGTFSKSEAILTRERMRDASIVAQGKRTAISKADWTYRDSTLTQLTFNAGALGTYVVGVSRETSQIEMEAARFNNYLEHDGVTGMLAQRTRNNTLDQNAVEKYAKHGKAIYQVGDQLSDDWKTVLDYPIEFVPLENPYEKHTGDTFNVQLLLDGTPLPNQPVYADYQNDTAHNHDDNNKEHSHDAAGNHTHNDDEASDNHTHDSGQKLMTDANGEVTVNLSHDGIYYLRTIHMVTIDDESDLTHRSKWATLTWETTHAHNSATHTHDDDEHHDHEDSGLPLWVFILGSIVLIAVLFFVFRKGKN